MSSSASRRAHLIFDLDGTLVDSAPGILEALRGALADCTARPLLPLTPALIGPPLRPLMARISGSDEPGLLDALVEAFKQRYDQEACRLAVPYPGIEEALRRLRSRGHVLHMATNKRSHPTQAILYAQKWTNLFRSVKCADSFIVGDHGKAAGVREILRAERACPADAMFIGDSIDDLEAATAVAVSFLGVTWGYGSAGLLTQYPFILTIDDPRDL